MNALNSLESILLDDLMRAGITIKQFNGAPNLIETYDSIRGTELEATFAKIICSHVDAREWKQLGLMPFYRTGCWLRARYLTMAKHGNKCQCCGDSPSSGAVLHVDHIKPRSKHPELALNLDNLQVLCADCNVGKSNKDDTDWRGI